MIILSLFFCSQLLGIGLISLWAIPAAVVIAAKIGPEAKDEEIFAYLDAHFAPSRYCKVTYIPMKFGYFLLWPTLWVLGELFRTFRLGERSTDYDSWS